MSRDTQPVMGISVNSLGKDPNKVIEAGIWYLQLSEIPGWVICIYYHLYTACFRSSRHDYPTADVTLAFVWDWAELETEMANPTNSCSCHSIPSKTASSQVRLSPFPPHSRLNLHSFPPFPSTWHTQALDPDFSSVIPESNASNCSLIGTLTDPLLPHLRYGTGIMKIAEMATAVLHPHHGSATSSTDNMAAHHSAEEDKQFIANYSEQQHTLPPDEVQQDPRNKELGRSSKGLSVRDFELVRTLGTGSCR